MILRNRRTGGTGFYYDYYSIGEFTHLPDFSWAVWDWASGHETCPLEGATSVAECHDFASHMGPV